MITDSLPTDRRSITPVTGAPRRYAPLLVALVASWVIPIVTNLIHVDWLLPPLLLVATAALLRGRTVLDRLICALVLLFAAALAFGLLLSVWPWHLAPVGVAGLGGTVLTAAAAITGRRPQLPRLYRRSDLITGGYGLVVAAAALYPLLRRDLTGRLSLFMHVEDFSRHMMIYDTIRVEGGYLFFHRADAIKHTFEPGFQSYPQGGHFIYALLENFAESSATPGNPLTWMSNFMWWHVGGFIAMCLAVLWGAQRVAGPAIGTWLSGALGALITAYLLLGDPITIYDSGYPQEVTCLAMVAVLVAVAIRPLSSDREQILLVGGLLVAVSFTYYLFLPVAGVIALGWLLVYRRRILPLWRYTLGVTVVSLVLAAVPPLENRSAGPGEVLLEPGQAVIVNTAPIWVLALACLAAFLVLTLQRRRLGMVGLIAVAAVGVFAIGVHTYQSANNGSSYFWYKTLHDVIIVVLVSCGGLAAVFRVPHRLSRRTWWRLAAPVAAAAVALASVGFFAKGSPTSMSQGRRYLTGRTSEVSPAAQDTFEVYQKYPNPDNKLTVVLLGGQWPQFYATLYLGILHHQYATAERFAQHIRPWNGAHYLPQMEPYIASSPDPVRVVTNDPDDLAQLQAFAKTLPPGQLEVVDFSAGG